MVQTVVGQPIGRSYPGMTMFEFIGGGPITAVTTWRGQTPEQQLPISHIEISAVGSAPTVLGFPYKLAGATLVRPQRGIGETTIDFGGLVKLGIAMRDGSGKGTALAFMGPGESPPAGYGWQGPPITGKLRGADPVATSQIMPVDPGFPYLIGLRTWWVDGQLAQVAGIYKQPDCPAGTTWDGWKCVAQPTYTCLKPFSGPPCKCAEAAPGWVGQPDCTFKRQAGQPGALVGRETNQVARVDFEAGSEVYSTRAWYEGDAIAAMEFQMTPLWDAAVGGFVSGGVRMVGDTSATERTQPVYLMNGSLRPTNAIFAGWTSDGRLTDFTIGINGERPAANPSARSARVDLIAAGGPKNSSYNGVPIKSTTRLPVDPDFVTWRGFVFYYDYIGGKFAIVGFRPITGTTACLGNDVIVKAGSAGDKATTGADYAPTGPNTCAARCKPGRPNAPCVCVPPPVERPNDPWDQDACAFKSEIPVAVQAVPPAAEVVQVAGSGSNHMLFVIMVVILLVAFVAAMYFTFVYEDESLAL